MGHVTLSRLATRETLSPGPGQPGLSAATGSGALNSPQEFWRQEDARQDRPPPATVNCQTSTHHRTALTLCVFSLNAGFRFDEEKMKTGKN